MEERTINPFDIPECGFVRCVKSLTEGLAAKIAESGCSNADIARFARVSRRSVRRARRGRPVWLDEFARIHFFLHILRQQDNQ